jgi:BASS family bile acid:Na+ symporter
MTDILSKIKSLLESQGKGIVLLLIIALGAVLPQLHVFTFMIQYLLMIMLFFAFLDLHFSPQMLHKSIFGILVANLAVAFAGYTILAPYDTTLALAAFMTGIAPTAIAAPVMVDLIKGKVEYVVAAVLVTNLVVAVIIPLSLPFLLESDVQISILDVLKPVLTVMFVPLLLAQLVAHLPTGAQAVIRKGKSFSFAIWSLNLLIVSANASNFLRTQNSSFTLTLLEIALVGLVICIFNFSVGALIGGRQYWQEASQSLGQKNLSFVIWVSLAFINPLVAMGPMFYVLYHHIYNAWVIYQYEKKRVHIESASGVLYE